MISTLKDRDARELLATQRLARLGCIAEGEPYVVPVNYAFDGESVIIHSLYGRKIEAMRENPRVCLQVDEIQNEFKWKSVIVYGRYEEITNPSERAEAMNHLLRLYPSLTPVETYIVEGSGTPAPIVFRVKIEKITSLCHA
jgi:hypothetical protein